MAYCDMKSVSSKTCDCIQGYERIGPNMTSGCVTKTSLSCGSDQFSPLVNMSFPYALNLLQLDDIKDWKGCRMECIKGLQMRCLLLVQQPTLQHFRLCLLDRQDTRTKTVSLCMWNSLVRVTSLSPSLVELLCHINRFLSWLSREEEEEEQDWIDDRSLSWDIGLVVLRTGYLLLLEKETEWGWGWGFGCKGKQHPANR